MHCSTAESYSFDVAGSLRGERIFITGATGFIGKVVVEKLLWSVPEVGKLLLLVRPGPHRSVRERLHDEVLDSPIMARLRALHGDDWEAWATSKVEAVPGDLEQDYFGLDPERYSELAADVDRVVAGAATVTFDERLDRALAINTFGALRTLTLARNAGNVPLLHVSTCFVSGQLEGAIPERVRAPESGNGGLFNLDATLATLEEACQQVRAQPDSGARLVTAGTEFARHHGFNDAYTLTKALGEQLLERHRRGVPVAIVRPAIVESAWAEPLPGWIDAIRVADPLLVAYGRGRSRDFPGSSDAPLEIVPVDYVAHAIIAALADLERVEEPSATSCDDVRVYQVGSSRNPITLGELLAWAREGFAWTPLRDEEGRPIPVPPARFVEPERYRRGLHARRARTRSLGRWLRTTRFASRLGGAERMLEHFAHLFDVYRPYVDHAATYEDEATQRLWNRLSPADRATFPFDVAALDWRDYVTRVHVPGVLRYALRAEGGEPPPVPAESVRGERRRDAAEASTLFELFAATARRTPDTVAFQTCRGGRWLRYTYGQALDTTANVAHNLAKRYGIGHGDRVVLWASGSPEWVLATFAVHRLGATVVPLDPQWPAPEIEEAARFVGAKLICAAPRLIEALGDPGCPVAELAAPLVPEPGVGLLSGAESVGASGGSGDLASILFTSGTTVAPKAVPLTHANYLANVRDLVPLMHLERDRLLSVLPIHHVFEQMVGLLVPVAGGCTISYVAEIKPDEINWMMATTRPTVLVAVPRLLELLHNGIFRSVAAGGPMLGYLFRVLFALSKLTGGRYGHRLFGKVHRRFGGSLRRIATGGSALEPSLGRSFGLMGFKVAEGYGMTETSPVLTVNPWQEIRFGSAGRPLPGVEVDLRPVEGATNGDGEIWVRGGNVMAGYYGNPEATSATMRDGWLNTGDIGHFDADGYLHISGRSKDVIVTAAGKNVYPEEVELRYRGLPHVEELIVLGLPENGRGESVCALVVPQPGATEADIEQVRDAIAARSAEVPSYQQVSKVEIWRGDLPKTTTLKVKRGKLREAVLAGERSGPSKAPAAAAPQLPELRSEAQTWMITTLARLTRTRPELLGATDRLADLGVDSLTRIELVGEIEARLGRRLDDAAAVAASRVQDLFDLLAESDSTASETPMATVQEAG